MSRDVGDRVAVRYESRNPDGVLTDATVVLTVTAPDGTSTTPTVAHTSTGIFDASFVLTVVDLWRWRWDVSGAITDVAYGQIAAANPAPLLYANFNTLKLALGIGIDDTTRDELLQGCLAAACRGIDNYTGRRFWADRDTSTRTYRTRNRTIPDPDGESLPVDDIATTVDLTVQVGDGVTWTTVTDYTTEPEDATVRGRPVTALRRNLGGIWSSYSRVRVITRWGWPAVPDEAMQASLIQAARLYRRKDSPEGVTGSAEWGAIRVSRIDPDVQALIKDLMILVP